MGTDVRIFSWISDIADVTLETDSSSTIVTLSTNQNSPTLASGVWSDFYIGFDGIPEDDFDTAMTYRIGVMPGTPSDVNCMIDALPVTPEESPSRKIQRQIKWATMSKEEREEQRQT